MEMTGREKPSPREGGGVRYAFHVTEQRETRLVQVDDGWPAVGTLQIAFLEVKRDLVKRALFPFFGLGKPENSTLGIQRGALSAHLLLTAYLHELVHDPPLLRCEAHLRTLA